MSNFIDLEPQVSVYYGTIPGQERRARICDALRYLDSHPDQVPGRTITESELNEKWRGMTGSCADFAESLGITVIPCPEPEPTNAKHGRDWWVENANVNDAEDCEACEGDLCPVHYGISMGIDLMARKMAALGDDPELFALIPDPVKAPGVDDE